jgi:lysophospholipase L1-like esterase
MRPLIRFGLASAGLLGALAGAGCTEGNKPLPVAGVHIASRAVGWNAAWNTTSDTYKQEYVHPRSWRLVLDACGSTVDGTAGGSRALPGVTWRFEPLEAQHPNPVEWRFLSPALCQQEVDLPAIGRWRITLTVTDSSADEASVTKTLTFRDLLVAAIGDSFASGEGNPVGAWADSQCHRSIHGWPQLVSAALENSTTAVTFLSLACSGARIPHLTDTPYGGQESGRVLAPQLKVLRGLLGDPGGSGTRAIDALLVTAGVNDIGVGDILAECIYPANCRRALGREFSRQPDLYDDLEVAISAHVRVRHTYFAGYPARLFTDRFDKHEACGIFNAMTDGDASWITDQGMELNRILKASAVRHDWSVVDTTDLFRYHGYCADNSTWFRGLVISEIQQNNEKGTAHPNAQGHIHTAEAVRPVIRTDLDLPPTSRFSVRFLKVRVTDMRRDPNYRGSFARRWDGAIRLGVEARISMCGHQFETVTNVREGVWVDVHADPCNQYTISTVGRAVKVTASTKLGEISYDDVQFGAEERPPKQNRSYLVKRVLRRADGFEISGFYPQAPPHVLKTSHDWGSLEIAYTVMQEQVFQR